MPNCFADRNGSKHLNYQYPQWVSTYLSGHGHDSDWFKQVKICIFHIQEDWMSDKFK